MFEGIGFWEALRLKMVIPLGLGWFRHVLSCPLRSVYTVFRNLETCLLFCYAGVCGAQSGCA